MGKVLRGQCDRQAIYDRPMVLIRQDIFHSQTEFLMENMQKIDTENYLVSLVHRQGYTKKSLKNFPSLHVQPKIKVTSR